MLERHLFHARVLAREECRRAKTKKPSARLGFFGDTRWRRRLPSRNAGCGRRARDVMPAAMRAEVRTSASARGSVHRARMVAPRRAQGHAYAQACGGGDVGRHRNAHAQAVARVVRQARAVLRALVRRSRRRRRSGDGTRAGPAPCGNRSFAAALARRLPAASSASLHLADDAREALGGRLSRGGCCRAVLLHARGRERLVDRIHPQHLRVIDAHVLDAGSPFPARDAAPPTTGAGKTAGQAAGAGGRSVIGPECMRWQRPRGLNRTLSWPRPAR